MPHRGPDDAGEWSDATGQAYLAHVRLAILDLSPAGHQPMTLTAGGATIIFNGEIYNFRELRTELTATGDVFHTESDTEVLLLGCQRHGAAFVARLRGMFAFCYWDSATQTALLARDPFGIKPLYYAEAAGQFCFASELRALLASGLITPTLNPVAVAHYFATGSMGGPETLLQGVSSLLPGHVLEWHEGQTKLSRYWQVEFPAPSISDLPTAVRTARAALEDSIRAHLVSDVPVGIFLSGGVDSTALLALMRQAQPAGIVKTFSVSVDDPLLDEASAAARTAAHFGTEHHEFKLDATSAAAAFPAYLQAMDVPSVDGFNTWMVSRFAQSEGMKVVLSGLGGDELLAGYVTFTQVPHLWRLGKWAALGGPLTRWAGKLLTRCGKSSKLQRLGTFLQGPPTLERAYMATRGVFCAEDALRLAQHFCGRRGSATPASEALPTHPLDAVSALELTRYMRKQLLRDSDVMSMAHGLELRVPFVDATLFDALAVIAPDLRLAQGKQLLLAAVPEIPQEIACAPKRGFSFPFEQWLASGFGDQFRAASTGLPVATHQWYQQWTVFVFAHWCRSIGVDWEMPLAHPHNSHQS